MSNPIEIDIAQVVEAKSGKKLPRWIARLLQRLIHEREINDILKRHSDKEGVAFFRALLQDLSVQVRWRNPEALPEHGRYLFVCNHPLGAIDGVGLSLLLAERYGDVRYLVNDMLYNLRPLRSIFLPVNTYGAQRRESVAMLQEAMQSDLPIGTFPAGYCSRHLAGRVQDRDWHKSFIHLATTYQRDIVPLHFVGRNSRHFYLVDRLRRRLGIRFDLSTALLPDEMFRTRGRSFEIIVGSSIPWQEVAQWEGSAHAQAQRIRSLSYALATELRP